jgi:MFS family permease
LRTYVTVLRLPGVLVPALGTALASLPIGMLALAILLLVRDSGGGFAAAGAVVAVFGVGTGLGMVSQGRLIDAFGPRPVLLTAAFAQATAMISVPVAAMAGGSPWLLGFLAFVTGLCEPQTGGALRSMWPLLVSRDQRTVASALSSILFEVPVVMGPLILAALLRIATVHVAIFAAAGLSLSGSIMVATSRVARNWTAVPQRRNGFLGPLAIREVRLIAAAVAIQGLTVGILQVSCAAFFASHSWPGDVAVLYALLSAGSLAGTVAYGVWQPSTVHWRQLRTLLAALAVPLLGAATAPNVLVLSAWVFVFGLVIGPISVRCFTDIEQYTPTGSLASSATTLIATGLAATSAGTAITGWLTDIGAGTGTLAGAAAGVLLCAFALFVHVGTRTSA